MGKYSAIGKNEIVKEGIFERFQDLIPAVPEKERSDIHKKLLIVAESNYFDDSIDSVFKNSEAWYKGEDVSHLIPEVKKKDVSNWIDYRSFNRLCSSMSEVSGINCKPIYTEASFYNYFLRPATVRGRNKSFKKDCKQIDRDVAGAALCGILDIDRPDLVIFVSKFAYDEFLKYIKKEGREITIPIDFVYHPAHPASWNHKNGAGKQKFESLLRANWLRNTPSV
ncbi:MAG: hypothetical protein IKP81_01820 [Paludibacteraceae bacterium]|nr:hypothetical protein [Paludibacteraceae bacterium]